MRASGVCTRKPPPTRLKSQAAFVAARRGQRDLEHADVDLLASTASASSVNAGRDQHLEELRRDRLDASPRRSGG